MIKKYRKKPVIIEAEIYKDWESFENNIGAPLSSIDSDSEWFCQQCECSVYKHANCKTLEGFHIVCPGDFIIKGIKGEFYPCKPDIFEMTYDKLHI